MALLCHGSLLYSYAHVSLVFIKNGSWKSSFLFTDVVETGIKRLIVAISKGGRGLIKGG